MKSKLDSSSFPQHRKQAKIEVANSNFKIEILKQEITELKQENIELSNNYNSQLKIEMFESENLYLIKEIESIKTETEAKYSKEIKSQKDILSKKHTEILTSYSKQLEEKYEKSHNKALKYFESQSSDLKMQIKMLSQELKAANQAILTVCKRKPVYSPGKYLENG